MYEAGMLSDAERAVLAAEIAKGVPLPDITPLWRLHHKIPPPLNISGRWVSDAERPRPTEPVVLPARVFGKVETYARARLVAKSGKHTTVEDIYDDYRKWCGATGLTPADGPKFVTSFSDVCEAAGIKLDKGGEVVYCLDCAIASSISS